MEFNQLQYFIEICDCGSITKAAAKVHITQQGLSSSVRRLEAELGCDLFYRKTGTLVLTEAGAQVYKESQKILKHIANIHEICNDNNSRQIPVRVMLSHSILPRLSPTLQKLLLSNSADIHINFKEAYSIECLEAVETDDTDFAIVYGEVTSPNTEVFVLDRLKQVFIVNKLHYLAGRGTIRLEDLDSLPFIAPEKPSYPRQLLNDMFKAKGLTLNVSYSCGRPRQVIELISNNSLLVSRIVEREITAEDRNRLSVLELEDEPFDLTISLVHKKGKPLSSQEKLFYSSATTVAMMQ